MTTLKNHLPKFIFTRQMLAAILIIVGVGVIIIYGLRSVRSYRQLQYIQEQGLDTGIADVTAIQPWMTLQYIGVAYGVPIEYLYAELDIPLERRNRHATIGQLNRAYRLGRPEPEEHPPIVQMTADAILAYRENPVKVGIRDIRPWMTIRYISTITGVPQDYIFDQLNIIPAENDENKPLDRLRRDAKFEGGPREMDEAIEKALAEYEETP